MNSSFLTKISLLCLILTQCFNSVLSAPTENSKSLKLSGTSNKYASPQLYVFGGYDGDKFLSSASHFNSSTGRWKTTTDMTVKRAHSCGVVIGTKVYLFGGSNSETTLRTAEVYDCETGTYTQFRSMPTPRAGCAAAVLDGYIYVVAGYEHPYRLSSVIRYNIQTTRLEDVTPTHVERDALRLVELRGRLYAIGGVGTKTAEMFNPKTNQWTSIASTKFEHRYFGATVHEGRIYVCSLAGCEVYSPDIDQWCTFPSPNNYVGSRLVSMNGKLWAIGGGINNSTQAGGKTVFTYDTFTEKWSHQPDMDVARRLHDLFVVYH